jgi:hypothetical protein
MGMKIAAAVLALIFVMVAGPGSTASNPSSPLASNRLDVDAAGRFARLALECVHREYPNKIAHVLNGDADADPPHELTPAFYGCYDWHSAVHGHWLLARLIRLFPDAPWADAARTELERSLTPTNIAGEVAYMSGDGRVSFERPYGLAWLLALSSELRSGTDRRSQTWSAALLPLEDLASLRIMQWLPKLKYPIRIGEHDQTAFAFGLIWDWASGPGHDEPRQRQMLTLLGERATTYYAHDRNCPIAYEPSGQDFLSPCLAEADLMRRVMDARTFAAWLKDFLPGIPTDGSATWLPPGEVTDRTDPKLAHIDGLNLSRAWMLEGIASSLPGTDRRIAALQSAAATHKAASLPAVTGEHYVGGHWLGTFAVYLLSKRPVPQTRK